MDTATAITTFLAAHPDMMVNAQGVATELALPVDEVAVELHELAEEGKVTAHPGWSFASTPASTMYRIAL